MLELVKGDITDQDVDCIVNAAHHALMGTRIVVGRHRCVSTADNDCGHDGDSKHA